VEETSEMKTGGAQYSIELSAKPHKSQIEALVLELLKKNAIADSPVDVQKIALGEGLAVIGRTFSDDVSGALISFDNGTAIAFNEQHVKSRVRFAVAHELAHHLLGHVIGEDHVDWEFTVIRRDSNASRAFENREVEANVFAINLLMPRPFIQNDASLALEPHRKLELNEERISGLAWKYRVSVAAMRFRLTELGYLPPY
jgi:Zn-dependent peptidase ImmA (M78 family)